MGIRNKNKALKLTSHCVGPCFKTVILKPGEQEKLSSAQTGCHTTHPAPQTSIYYLFSKAFLLPVPVPCAHLEMPKPHTYLSASQAGYTCHHYPPRGSMCTFVHSEILRPGAGWGSLEPQMLGCRDGEEGKYNGSRHSVVQSWFKHQECPRSAGQGVADIQAGIQHQELSPRAASPWHSSDLTQGQASSLSGSGKVGKLMETYFEGAVS